MYSTDNSTSVFGKLVMVKDPSSAVKSPEIIAPFNFIATDAKPTLLLVFFR